MLLRNQRRGGFLRFCVGAPESSLRRVRAHTEDPVIRRSGQLLVAPGLVAADPLAEHAKPLGSPDDPPPERVAHAPLDVLPRRWLADVVVGGDGHDVVPSRDARKVHAGAIRKAPHLHNRSSDAVFRSPDNPPRRGSRSARPSRGRPADLRLGRCPAPCRARVGAAPRAGAPDIGDDRTNPGLPYGTTGRRPQHRYSRRQR